MPVARWLSLNNPLSVNTYMYELMKLGGIILRFFNSIFSFLNGEMYPCQLGVLRILPVETSMTIQLVQHHTLWVLYNFERHIKCNPTRINFIHQLEINTKHSLKSWKLCYKWSKYHFRKFDSFCMKIFRLTFKLTRFFVLL